MTPDDLTAHLLCRLHEVRSRLGLTGEADAQTRFADAVDSMALVEFVGLLADECGVEPTDIEEAVGRHFTTIGELARVLHGASILPGAGVQTGEAILPASIPATVPAWLAATTGSSKSRANPTTSSRCRRST